MEVNRGPLDSSHQEKVEKSKALESMLKLRIALQWFSAYHIFYDFFIFLIIFLFEYFVI